MPSKAETLDMYRRMGSWKMVGNALGVDKAVAYRYANEEGWEPKRPDLRKKLGLPKLEIIQQVRGPKGTFIGRDSS